MTENGGMEGWETPPEGEEISIFVDDLKLAVLRGVGPDLEPRTMLGMDIQATDGRWFRFAMAPENAALVGNALNEIALVIEEEEKLDG